MFDFSYLGRPRGDLLTLKEFQADYSSEYHTLSAEKRLEYLEGLKTNREEKIQLEHAMVRKVGQHATADIRTVTKCIVDATSTLPERAGYAFLCFGAKTDYAGSAAPVDIMPDCIRGFCEQILRHSPELIALKLETFLLKGGQAALEVKETKQKDLRSMVTDLLRISFRT